MLDTIAYESENISNMITNETNERTEKMNTLTYDLNHSSKSQKNFIKGFYEGSIKEFLFTFNKIEGEMDNRFDH